MEIKVGTKSLFEFRDFHETLTVKYWTTMNDGQIILEYSESIKYVIR